MREIQEIPIKQLTLLERNPRRITKEQMQKLCTSIQNDPEFLFSRPVLVNKKEGILNVYAGNQRVQAAKKLKWKTIPCIIEENTSDEVIKQRVIKDNKQFGEFDWDILANEWDVDELLESGFSADELVGAVQDIDTEKEQEGNDTEKCQICPSCGYEF